MEQHRALLRQLSAEDYLQKVASAGRAYLPATMRKAACLLYDVSEWIQSTETAEPGLRKAFALINDVFVAEDFLQSAPLPRYIHYANMRLLDRYLLAEQSCPLAERHARARRALAIIMRDWFEFEQERLSAFDDGKLPTGVRGYTFKHGDQDDPVSHLRERLRTLDILSELAAVADLPDTHTVRKAMALYPSDWEYFTDDPDRELAKFLCLPRSMWHDEVMFLRMIHATECCFAGIIASLETLPALALGRDWLSATQVLKEATFFSDFLIKHWEVFETMPVPHFFDGFRGDTGNASAIQSQRFQRLDTLIRGLGDAKREALRHQPESRKFADWHPPDVATLSGLVMAAREVGAEGEEFIAVAHDLDADLHAWRSKHYGVAIRYMPEDAVGTGNEGRPYLKATYAAPRLARGGAAAGKSAQTSQGGKMPTFRRTSTMALIPNRCPRLAAFRFGPVSSDAVREFVAAAREQLAEEVALRHAQIVRTINAYGDFFGANKYPVASQFQKFVANGQLANAVAPALLLALELRTGVLMGIQRPAAGAMITFDVATEGEIFLGIGGKDVQCAANEPVVRDPKGIIASVFQGPDRRTMVDFDNRDENAELLLIVMGYPDMPSADFEEALADCRNFISKIGSPLIEEWQV